MTAKKLRVAIVSSHPPGKGTLNEYGYHVINHLRKKSYMEKIILVSDVLPTGEQYALPDDQVPIEIDQVWNFNSWMNPLKILRSIRRHKPDVVLYNIQFLSFGDGKIPAALGLLTPWLTKLFGFPSVVLLHNILETVDLESAGITTNKLLQSIYGLIGTLLTRFILSADLVTVTIPKYVKVLEEKYRCKNVALIPHGSFELPPMPDFTSKPDPQQVMTFGKFGTYKKVEVIIDAVEIIRKRADLKIEILIAGTDSPNRVGYLEEIKQKYAHVEGIKFTGYVAEEDVPRIFDESTVVVFGYTSTTGSSGVLHQAGSYGKAALIPNIGDLGQLVIEEGYAGTFFETEDAESLADELQRMLEDETYRTESAKQNYFAAASLPMEDIMDWYYMHFAYLASGKKGIPRTDKQPVPIEASVLV